MTDIAGSVSEARRMLAIDKSWVGTDLRWVSNGKKIPGYSFQNALALQDGLQPAGLYVCGYFKRSNVPGAADKLYFNLVSQSRPIHALHENGVSRHENRVGVLEPLYGQLVGHPHRHRICDDAVEGYAEPIGPVDLHTMWTWFLSECNISGAPGLQLPVTQGRLL